MSKIVGLILIALALLLAALGYRTLTSKPSSTDSMDRAMPSMSTVSSAGEEATATTEGEVKVFTLDAKMFSFSPNVLKVKQGDKVKVVINNIDSDPKFEIMHDFVLDELGVKSAEVGEGESTSVEFVADRIGIFEFYCSVGKHRENGQVGTFIVSE